MKNVYVAIYINNRNTYLAISDDENNHKIIDMSYGYGKTYSKSMVVFSDDEFSFLENALSSDIFDDTSVFESILELINDDVEINGVVVDKVELLSKFLGELLKLVNEQSNGATIKSICIAYEQINSKNVDKVFIDAFNSLGIVSKKVVFVTPKEALYFEALKQNENEVNVAFFDNKKTSIFNLSKNIDGSYKETEKSFDSFNVDMFCETFISKLTEVYKESKGLTSVSEEERVNIAKLFYENMEMIVSKYLAKEDCKIFYNFTFPPLAYEITYDFVHNFLKESLLNIKIEENSFVYIEEIDTKILNTVSNTFSPINILLGVLYKAKNINSVIEIKDIKDLKYDYGFMLNRGGKDVFFPIVRKDDSYLTKIKEQYFYLTNNAESLTLYKHDDEYIPIYNLDLKDLNTLTEYVKIKLVARLTEKNSLVLELTNLGFLNTCTNDKVLFEINEV